MEHLKNSTKTPVIITWLLLIALAIIPPLFATAFTRYDWLKSSTLLVVTGFASVLWALSIFRGEKSSWKNAKSGLLILGFGAFALLSLIWAPNAGYGLENAMLWLMFSVLSLLFATCQSKALTLNLPVAISIGVGVSSLMCLADFLGVEVFSMIWDAPGSPGAFDGVNQAGTYFVLAICVLLITFHSTVGWRRYCTIIGLLLAAASFGAISSINIVHIGLFIALIASLWITHKQSAFLLLSAAVLSTVAITFFTLPRHDPSTTISNKFPVVYEESVKVVSDIKSSKVQNTNLDINRIADTDMGKAFNILVDDLFSRDPMSMIIGEGAGSWWLNQNPKLPKNVFKYYSIQRDSPGLPLFELGLLGMLFFGAFIFTILFTKSEDKNIAHIGIPLFLMIVVAGSFSTLATSLLLLACALGTYSSRENEAPEFVFNAEGTRGLSMIMAFTIMVSGFSFIGFGSFSGIARYKESRGDLLLLRRKYADASKAYEAAYSFSKLEPSVAYNYALALQKVGSDGLASQMANEALMSKPNDARYLYLVSQLLFSQRNPDKAANKDQFRFITDASKSAEKAVELFPNYIEAIKSLVMMQELQGRRATANQTLQSIIKLDPPADAKRKAHSELGQSFTVLGKPRSALEHYKKALIGERNRSQKQSLSIRIAQIEAKLQEEKLMQEGKPIPESLRRKLKQHNHSGHDH